MGSSLPMMESMLPIWICMERGQSRYDMLKSWTFSVKLPSSNEDIDVSPFQLPGNFREAKPLPFHFGSGRLACK